MPIPANSMPTGGTSPQVAQPAPTGPSPPALGAGQGIQYDPNQPVFASNDPGNTSFRAEVSDIYSENSPEVKLAREQAKQGYGGQGLLFSDIAARGGESAAMGKAMDLAAPEVEYARQKERTADAQAFQRGETRQGQRFQKGETRQGQQFQKGMTEAGQEFQKGETRQGQEYQKGMTEAGQEFQKGETRQGQEFQARVTEKANDFQREMTGVSQQFQEEMTNLGFSNNMEAALLTSVQGMMNTGLQAYTSLAMSPEATAAEVDNIRQSNMNMLQTFTNIWKGSADSKDKFDFSTIG